MQLLFQELYSVLLLAIFNLFWYVGKCTVSVFLNKHSLSEIWCMSGLNLLWRHWLDEFLATDWCWRLCTGSHNTTINFICWKFGSKFHFKEEHSSYLNYQWYFLEFLCSSKIRSLYSMSELKKIINKGACCWGNIKLLPICCCLSSRSHWVRYSICPPGVVILWGWFSGLLDGKHLLNQGTIPLLFFHR